MVMVIEECLGTKIIIKSDGIMLEEVEQYRYLGILIKEVINCWQEVKKRSGIGRKSLWD